MPEVVGAVSVERWAEGCDGKADGGKVRGDAGGGAKGR